VTLVLELARETQGILKRDSIATIQSEGLLGDKYVELSAGSQDGEKLKDWDIIGSQPPVDIANLIHKTNEILDSAKEAVQNTAEATGDLKSITGKINRGQGTVGALINDATVFNQAAAGATAFRENMDALKQNFLLRGFFKKRGYEDATELSRNAISRLPSGPPMKTYQYDGKKLFDKDDNAKLKNEKSLNDAGKFLQETKFGLAIVTAVAGTKGDSDKLRELTAARAVTVRDYLVNNFQLEDQRIKTLGLGKGKEPDDGGTVEIIVYPVGASATQAKPAKGAGRR
jgi:phospholipid/cholesterol/gamma-HCH transport system substrate-binding protein